MFQNVLKYITKCPVKIAGALKTLRDFTRGLRAPTKKGGAREPCSVLRNWRFGGLWSTRIVKYCKEKDFKESSWDFENLELLE